MGVGSPFMVAKDNHKGNRHLGRVPVTRRHSKPPCRLLSLLTGLSAGAGAQVTYPGMFSKAVVSLGCLA